MSFQEKVRQQDSAGNIKLVWTDLATNVAAAIEPLSAKDYFAAQSAQSEATTRITVRWRAGLSATQRIVHATNRGVTTIYNPTAPINDRDSGLEFVTIYCSTGVNEGA